VAARVKRTGTSLKGFGDKFVGLKFDKA